LFAVFGSSNTQVAQEVLFKDALMILQIVKQKAEKAG
jgi:hypothetical protein